MRFSFFEPEESNDAFEDCENTKYDAGPKANIPKFGIFDKTTGKWFVASPEEYKEYIRQIDAHVHKMKDHGRCCCPADKKWLCDGCCQGCRYEVRSRYSIYDSLPDGGERLVDAVADKNPDSLEIAANKEMLDRLFTRLNELMPEAQTIGELRLQEATDEEIGEILNIKRTTFRSRLDKVKAILRSEFGEEFPF